MREINISVCDDKTIKTNNEKLGNKLDNGITKLIFSFNECSFDESLIYKYCALKNSSQDIFYLVEIPDNYFVLSDFYTKVPGNYSLLVILSDTELESGCIDINGNTFVSDVLNMVIEDNFLNDNFEIKENEEAM